MAEQSRPKDPRRVTVRPKQKSRVILPNDAKSRPLPYPGQMPSANPRRRRRRPVAMRSEFRAMITAAKRE